MTWSTMSCGMSRYVRTSVCAALYAGMTTMIRGQPGLAGVPDTPESYRRHRRTRTNLKPALTGGLSQTHEPPRVRTGHRRRGHEDGVRRRDVFERTSELEAAGEARD